MVAATAVAATNSPGCFNFLRSFSIFHAVFIGLCCYFAFKEDELGCKKEGDSAYRTHSLTQTLLERLEEGERGSSESNGVEAKSKDCHSSL